MTEWKESSVAEIISLIGGRTPKTKANEYWNGDIPWLSVVDFNTSRKFVYDSEKKHNATGIRK